MFDRASLKLGLDKAVLQSIGSKDINNTVSFNNIFMLNFICLNFLFIVQYIYNIKVNIDVYRFLFLQKFMYVHFKYVIFYFKKQSPFNAYVIFKFMCNIFLILKKSCFIYTIYLKFVKFIFNRNTNFKLVLSSTSTIPSDFKALITLLHIKKWWHSCC